LGFGQAKLLNKMFEGRPQPNLFSGWPVGSDRHTGRDGNAQDPLGRG